jgi:hypothetical protein
MLFVDLFESAVIAKFAYDCAARNLVIFFKGGGVYAYGGVPREVFEAFRAAPSKGRYFRGSIRERFAARALSPAEIGALLRRPGGGVPRPQSSLVLVEIARRDRPAATTVFF